MEFGSWGECAWCSLSVDQQRFMLTTTNNSCAMWHAHPSVAKYLYRVAVSAQAPLHTAVVFIDVMFAQVGVGLCCNVFCRHICHNCLPRWAMYAVQEWVACHSSSKAAGMIWVQVHPLLRVCFLLAVAHAWMPLVQCMCQTARTMTRVPLQSRQPLMLEATASLAAWAAAVGWRCLGAHGCPLLLKF